MIWVTPEGEDGEFVAQELINLGNPLQQHPRQDDNQSIAKCHALTQITDSPSLP